MTSVTVSVQPDIIRWALRQSHGKKLNENLQKHVEEWLAGIKNPTLRQLEDFSKAVNIPFGYFFLKTPPEEEVKLIEFRTVDSIQLENPSRELIDTVYSMETIQNWMRSYRQDLGYDRISVAGSLKGRDISVIQIADTICMDLNIDRDLFRQYNHSAELFRLLREKLEENGVVVMMNGIVGNNTHRKLNIKEFRAFAMMDEWAPLIFINSTDSKNAQLFSLLHEIVHIWLGENDFYNSDAYEYHFKRNTEKICNAVSAEILVPDRWFNEKWNMDTSALRNIETLSDAFHCSQVVIARKAMDHKYIVKTEYESIVARCEEYYKKANENRKKSGGDYYRTMGSRLDKTFVRALCESVNIGRTSFTEACRLTGTTLKTFKEIARQMDGGLWTESF